MVFDHAEGAERVEIARSSRTGDAAPARRLMD